MLQHMPMVPAGTCGTWGRTGSRMWALRHSLGAVAGAHACRIKSQLVTSHPMQLMCHGVHCPLQVAHWTGRCRHLRWRHPSGQRRLRCLHAPAPGCALSHGRTPLGSAAQISGRHRQSGSRAHTAKQQALSAETWRAAGGLCLTAWPAAGRAAHRPRPAAGRATHQP